jgi:hypothetical protein
VIQGYKDHKPPKERRKSIVNKSNKNKWAKEASLFFFPPGGGPVLWCDLFLHGFLLMVSLSAPHTRTDIGCIHSGSLWDSSGLVLIDSEWRLITISHVLIGSARCVTYRSQRQRGTSFFGAPYTMRSEDVTTASTGTQGAPSLLSSDIRIRGA